MSGQEVFELSRVGSGGVQISRIGPGHPDPIRPASSDPTREKPCSFVISFLLMFGCTLSFYRKNQFWGRYRAPQLRSLRKFQSFSRIMVGPTGQVWRFSRSRGWSRVGSGGIRNFTSLVRRCRESHGSGWVGLGRVTLTRPDPRAVTRSVNIPGKIRG